MLVAKPALRQKPFYLPHRQPQMKRFRTNRHSRNGDGAASAAARKTLLGGIGKAIFCKLDAFALYSGIVAR